MEKEIFARFKKELKAVDGDLVFKADDGTKKTRYLVLIENEDEIYVAIHPNDFKTKAVGRFPKKDMDEVLFLVEEMR